MKKLVLFILLFALPCFATTHEVATVGQLDTACSTAVAGDVIQIRAGTYNLTSAGQIVLENSGTGTGAGQRITVEAYAGESVTINASAPSAIVVKGDYWEWNGARMTFNYAQNIGFDITSFVESGVSGDYFYLHHITMNATSCNGDNSGGVKIDNRGHYLRLEYSTIDGPGTCGSSNNAGIYITYSKAATIKNNDISDAPRGIYFKHANDAGDTETIVENNYIHDCNHTSSNYVGINLFWNDVTIKNNLFVNNDININLGDNGGGPAGCDDNIIENNTFYSSDDRGVVHQLQDGNVCEDNTYSCNVFMDTGGINMYASNAHRSLMDYNLYNDSDVWRRNYTNYTLSTWRTHLGGCPGSNNDCNSQQDTPIYEGGGSPSSISDYALTAASPGYQDCDDGSDMGANVTLVGPDAATGEICGNDVDDDGDGDTDCADSDCVDISPCIVRFEGTYTIKGGDVQ